VYLEAETRDWLAEFTAQRTARILTEVA
jgi:hypothetical protein